MNKLKTREDVVEQYWLHYIDYCMRSQDSPAKEFHKEPTLDGFWQWYITDGPLGLKHKNKYYTKINDLTYL